jgi:DMSO/TMAO reductase YedYZ molybdopterin-dependent catalytic subunit
LKSSAGRNKWAIIGLIMGVILISSASAYYLSSSVAEEPIDWEVKLAGSNGEQQVITYDEIRRMPYQEASGGLLTSAGIVYGPYRVKGVLLQDLCDLVGGINPSEFVSVSAPDGYSMAFGYDQLVSGDFLAWDPETMHEVSNEKHMVLLTYEWDGKPIHNNDGGPLRLVVVSNKSLLTEGHNWVMWVDEIEINRIE